MTVHHAKHPKPQHTRRAGRPNLAFSNKEMDRRIALIAEELRKRGKHPRENGVTVRRVDPEELRR